ncbi:MAG TPA: DUF5107 domain-containing protein [Bacteroidales bacterium]|nr:DUF5107 domain-containing protein [Bacteroidales bacterium]
MRKNNLYKNFVAVLVSGFVLLFLPDIVLSQTSVRIWEADEVIPTYKAGPPDPNPMFFFGKQSQGAEGRIYPYPLYDNLTNVKSDKTYHLVYLENEYVKIGILPEIGGRIFSAVDKTNNYNFIYKQSVIKPALIGLIGAWISGGVEWNIPHHHRASTFLPVQWSRVDNPDGSKTVWIGELEIRHRMRWAVGYTLRPGSSILECSVRIVNRTPVANSMLCFANIAVHTNENYQVIFPPRTQWSTGHSKRSFSPWPVVNGLDVSWYKNNLRSASWFAVNYEDDFVAGYDHGKNAGIMSVADHNIVPGKKFFTWGVGSMWDKILTDDDGPYLEIMVGAYSDNQPDYSWMHPYEERAFKIYLYPFRGIEGAKNANHDAAVNLEVKDGKALFGFYTTRSHSNAVVTLKAADKVLLEEKISINPENPYKKEISLPEGIDEHDLRASISAEGSELISYSPVRIIPEPMPMPYTDPKAPADIDNNEELFLAGLRIDQFHHPSLDADPYYLEVLRRDSANVAANTEMGILSLKKARYAEAEKYLNTAIRRLTAKHTTPKNAEPFYYLGLALKKQWRLDEAYTAFYKAAWEEEWKSPAYFSLAEIATTRGDFNLALEFIDRAIDGNAYNLRAYVLKSSILRHLNRVDEAVKLVACAQQKCDPLDAHLMAEKWMASKDKNTEKILFETTNSHPAVLQEIAASYYNCGLWSDGLNILQQSILKVPDKSAISPIIYYYMGYFAEKLDDNVRANEYYNQAVLQPPDYVFPFQDELIPILNSAMAINPRDARAPYYLGNLLYDWQPEVSVKLWEKSAELDPGFPITWRNLAIAYSHQNINDSKAKAIACLEKAIAVSKQPYANHLIELDRLYQATNVPVSKRLALFEKYESVVLKSDEALGNMINLKNFAGKADESIRLLRNRTFSIWEGGQAFNTGQAWADANLILGLQQMKKKKYRDAISSFEAVFEPPENLRAEQRFSTRNYMVSYWKGCAYEALGEKENAKNAWNEVINPTKRTLREGVAGGGVAAGGGMGPGGTGAGYVGGRNIATSASLEQLEQRYFEALAREKLGFRDGNKEIFNELISTAAEVLKQPENTDSAASQLNRRQQGRPITAVAHYIAGLGYSGLGDRKKAKEEFTSALSISQDYLNAKIALDQL